VLDILSMLDGWKYDFPYFEQGIPISNTNYYTLYQDKNLQIGGIVYAVLVTSTPEFHIKLSTGNTDLHEISVSGVLYGQAPTGFNVPSGFIANVYIPTQQTVTNYPIRVADPQYPPATAIGLEATDLFPYNEGIKVQARFLNPPAIIYEFSLGLVKITNKDAYLKSLQMVYGGK
jgi:hypothetical protein